MGSLDQAAYSDAPQPARGLAARLDLCGGERDRRSAGAWIASDWILRCDFINIHGAPTTLRGSY
jgi:hypothetical protein